MGVLRLALRHWVVGEAVVQVAGQVELTALGDADRVGYRFRVIAEQLGHLFRRLQVVLGVLAALAVGGVQGRAVLDGHQHVLEAVALPYVAVDVAGGDGAQAQVLRQVGQGAVAAGIAVDEVVLELNEEVGGAEPLEVAAGGLLGLAVAALRDERRHLAPVAAGEGDEPLGVLGEGFRLDAGPAALVAQMGVGEETTEVGVAALGLAEEGQVVAVGQRDLGAGDGAQAPGAGALGELHRPV